MKNCIVFSQRKGLFALFLLLFFVVASNAQAPLDLTGKVEKLPKRDGTFLLHNEKGNRLYAVKKDGKIVDYKWVDKKGNELESTMETVPEQNTELKVGARAWIVCSKCTRLGGEWYCVCIPCP